MVRFALTSLFILLSKSTLATTIIHAGFLFDTQHGEILEEQSITIEEGRVVSVTDGFITPEGSTVVDLRRAYVSPGFMDMHVHLDGELNPPASYSEEFFMNSADIALRSSVFAERTLDAGFTTVRDLGAGDIQAIFALRDAIAKGLVDGPRIFAAGQGHGHHREAMVTRRMAYARICVVTPVPSRVLSMALMTPIKQCVSVIRTGAMS
jgi:imidazolonepropionase-like amidohydrolase